MSEKTHSRRDAEGFSLRISSKAPPFLDEAGRRLPEDELASSWSGLAEAFSRLHGQRLLEVVERIFQEMPPEEKIWFEWEDDETRIFYFRFSNDWSLDAYTVSADDPNSTRWSHQSSAIAPGWFPRDHTGLSRWKGWHSLLHESTISPEVDGLALGRLHGAVPASGLTLVDLPRLKRVLLGEDWTSSLEYMEISSSTAMPVSSKRKTPGRL